MLAAGAVWLLVLVQANTTDTRETAAIDICRGLLQDGAQLAVYDPKVGAGRRAEGGGWRAGERA